MRALLVEDDATIAEFVARGLREAGFAVDHAIDGEAGLNAALAQPYDVADLARGIAWVLAQPREQLRAAARAKITSTFDAREMADRYIGLYQELIAARRRAVRA